MKKHVFLNHKTSNVPASGSRRASFLILNEQEDGIHTATRQDPNHKDAYLAKMGYLYRILKMGAVGATVGAVATITAGALFST